MRFCKKSKDASHSARSTGRRLTERYLSDIDSIIFLVINEHRGFGGCRLLFYHTVIIQRFSRPAQQISVLARIFSEFARKRLGASGLSSEFALTLMKTVLLLICKDYNSSTFLSAVGRRGRDQEKLASPLGKSLFRYVILQTEHSVFLMWSYRCVVKRTLTALCSYKTAPRAPFSFVSLFFFTLYPLRPRPTARVAVQTESGKLIKPEPKVPHAPTCCSGAGCWTEAGYSGVFQGYLRPTCDGGIWKLHPSLLARTLSEGLVRSKTRLKTQTSPPP